MTPLMRDSPPAYFALYAHQPLQSMRLSTMSNRVQGVFDKKTNSGEFYRTAEPQLGVCQELYYGHPHSQ